MLLVNYRLIEVILKINETKTNIITKKKLIHAYYEKSGSSGFQLKSKLVKKFYKFQVEMIEIQIDKRRHWTDIFENCDFILHKKMMIDYRNPKAINDLTNLYNKSWLILIETFWSLNKLRCVIHPNYVVYADDSDEKNDFDCCVLTTSQKVDYFREKKIRVLKLKRKVVEAIKHKFSFLTRIRESFHQNIRIITGTYFRNRFKTMVYKVITQIYERKNEKNKEGGRNRLNDPLYNPRIIITSKKHTIPNNRRVMDDYIWLINKGYICDNDEVECLEKHSTPIFIINGSPHSISDIRKKDKRNLQMKGCRIMKGSDVNRGLKILKTNFDYLSNLISGIRKSKHPFNPGIKGRLTNRIANLCLMLENDISHKTLSHEAALNFCWIKTIDFTVIYKNILF